MLRGRRESPVEVVERSSFEGLSDEVERRSELQEILADLGELPERQRATLVLAQVSDLKHAEVARSSTASPSR